MDWMLYIVAALFALFGAACLVMVVIQLPGVWITVTMRTGQAQR